MTASEILLSHVPELRAPSRRLFAALIAVAILTVLGLVGDQLNITFTKIKEALVTANGKK